MQLEGTPPCRDHAVNRLSRPRLNVSRRGGRRLIAITVLCAALVSACGESSAGDPAATPPDLTVDLGGGVTMDFVLVRTGTFTMGEHPVDFGTSSAHQVKIAKPFYLGRYEVTQEQWQAVMGKNPSFHKGSTLPVDALHWDDCRRFVAKLNGATTGPKYFMPSEAQWEYACRAGSSTNWSFGDDETRLGEYAWYRSNCGGRVDPNDPSIMYDGSTHPVGQKKPNAWGLYDMHGNVGEWCADEWHDDFKGAPTDGSAWESANASVHVVRGSDYGSTADFLRSACRGMGEAPTATSNVVAGFRLARLADSTLADKPAPFGGAGTDLPAATPEVEAAAMRILETYRDATSAHYPDPREKDLVAIGRPALSVFLRALCDPAFKEQWAMHLAIQKVLPTLVLDADVPMLARLMRDGHLGVEVAFANLNAPESVATYAALLREGRFGAGLHDAARPHLRDPAVVQACCAWLADPKYDGDLNFAIAKMAELMGGTGPYRLQDDPPPEVAKLVGAHRQPLPEIVPEAAPALKALLERPLRVDARRHVAAALVRVGDMAGIPVLIEILGAPSPADGRPDAYQRHAAGLQLNAVSHTAMYWKPAFDEHTMTVVREDQFALAAQGFRDWWAKAQKDLRFDPATQNWSIK